MEKRELQPSATNSVPYLFELEEEEEAPFMHCISEYERIFGKLIVLLKECERTELVRDLTTYSNFIQGIACDWPFFGKYLEFARTESDRNAKWMMVQVLVNVFNSFEGTRMRFSEAHATDILKALTEVIKADHTNYLILNVWVQIIGRIVYHLGRLKEEVLDAAI